ncbi:MAG TPA: glycosyltransferase family 39 protein [Solirubrobacteraceae bacterium]|jgi:4-amino-4-deoxy-L-arabinose transferase-like glycosyltransferase
MSTPSISAPSHAGDLDRLTARAAMRARGLLCGNEADPVWSRPGLLLVGLLAGVLTLWGLTRSGYANTYYAEAAQAASRSWKAWFTNAVDTSGTVSLDKGPLPNMVMGLSGRLFGFSSFSMLLPEALCGVGAVLLLHNTVKRTLGHRVALLAALMLALTPIFVAMSRFNNPDALLVLLEVAAAWALVRALQSGRTREVLLCGVFVGLAFNVKMLQAYLIVPALAATLLIAGQGSLRRRVSQLLAGGASMVAVSFVWYATMMSLGAGNRPWVGDTKDNSWWSLIFGANGFGRVSGEGAGPGGGGAPGGGQFGGAAGLLRMFNSIVGGQIAWLLPLALVGFVLGLWMRRGSPRTDLARSAYVLWGCWAVASWAVFSFSQGIFHPYYTTALAPAVAVLGAGGSVVLWDRARRSTAWAVVLACVGLATVALAAMLLGRASGFVPFLAPAAMTLAGLAAVALLLARVPAAGSETVRRRLALGAATAGVVALLAGPIAYSLATVGKSLNGGNPLAGPASAETLGAGFGLRGAAFGGGVPRGAPPGGGVPGSAPPAGASGAGQFLPPGIGAGALGTGAGGAGARTGAAPGEAAVSKALVSYLKAHQGKAKYIVAAVGSQTAGSIALASGRETIDMGGFMGSDPAPSLAKLQSFIASGQLHYVLVGGAGAGGGFSGGGPGQRSSATSARNAWIEAHGTVVHVGGGSTGATLYYFA